ncbi:hypothetical protein I545_3999 [Mycobacterium kansasii 662]|uniref:Uncharacterized protein n=1 Tax=Mycobacterium kansasii 662 TaxID=1299326 RepID=X7ZBM5_MYCKA|nr:hypothetical protein I545_3999 [Mycobacterium kansasii 662]
MQTVSMMWLAVPAPGGRCPLGITKTSRSMTYDRQLRQTRAVNPPRDDVSPLRAHPLAG